MNTRQQGDLGEASAVEWFANQGAPVFLPFGHSPDVDLITRIDGRWAGVQCKTTTRFRKGRWMPMIATRGGNQSWTGVAKHFEASRCDYLFVLVADGRRWFIPASEVDARSGLALGGPKYAAFEIEAGRPIRIADP